MIPRQWHKPIWHTSLRRPQSDERGVNLLGPRFGEEGCRFTSVLLIIDMETYHKTRKHKLGDVLWPIMGARKLTIIGKVYISLVFGVSSPSDSSLPPSFRENVQKVDRIQHVTHSIAEKKSIGIFRSHWSV